MEYILIVLIVISIVIGIINLTKNINETNVTERIGRLETSLVKELGDFKNDFSRSLNEDFKELNTEMELRLRMISDRVNTRIDDNFKKTNETFTSVLERLTKIDEAQKKIDSLSMDIVSLQNVLTDKKSRGIFGEVNLYHIISSVFGEKSDSIYQMQYTYSNGTTVDCALFAPSPLGTISIDSKFPLENYKRMVDKENSEEARVEAAKKFKRDIKKHIDDISNKYIITGVTSDQAIMFLPAEAIFAEINAYHEDIIRYAYSKRVWLTSPTTLLSTLTTIQIIMMNMERDKYASVIHKELKLLSAEFIRYQERWDKLSRSIDTVNKDVKDIHITTEKITKRFDMINQVEIDTSEED